MAEFVLKALCEEGFEAAHAEGFEEGLKEIETFKPDVVILDLMIPGGSGLDLLQQLRQEGNGVPVLVLSAKSSMQERVTGLDAGADDYLPKPFGIEELLARLRVLLRRKGSNANNTIHVGPLKIDLSGRRVHRDERLVFLSDTEFRLLEVLASQKGQPISKRQILTEVWDDPARDDNVVEVYIRYLRTKLERRDGQHLIHTVRGRGYVLSESYDED